MLRGTGTFETEVESVRLTPSETAGLFQIGWRYNGFRSEDTRWVYGDQNR